MPTGVSWNPKHTDITNHYLEMGVLGGLPATFLFVSLLVTGFAFVGRIVRFGEGLTPEQRFFVWTLGAALFAHVATCISVSYFDQSVFFIYLTLAGIASSYQAVFAPQVRPLQGPAQRHDSHKPVAYRMFQRPRAARVKDVKTTKRRLSPIGAGRQGRADDREPRASMHERKTERPRR